MHGRFGIEILENLPYAYLYLLTAMGTAVVSERH